MPVDIINAPALHAVVEAAIAGVPDVLLSHASRVRVAMRHAAGMHRSVRPARRRQTDPAWALAAFATGRILHRFDEREAPTLAEELGEVVTLLAEVAGIDGSGAAEAGKFLRGLPHRREGLDDLTCAAQKMRDRAWMLRLLGKRHTPIRTPAEIAADSLVAIRCSTLDAVIRLGREAHNCLADDDRYWRRFAQGSLDLWALREEGRLAAVLAVAGTQVEGAFGTGNALIPLDRVQAVARVCTRAGWTFGDSCKGLLSEYAGPILIGPLRLTIGDRVVVYAEWANAVRIDMSGGANEDDDDAAFLLEMIEGTRSLRILTLAFDPDQSCSDAILYGRDPRPAVAVFGTARLRCIVAGVALGCAVPTVVQHRLLALTA